MTHKTRKAIDQQQKAFAADGGFDWRSIKTFDDACRAKGTTEEEFNRKWKDILPVDTFNYEKIKLIIGVINAEWKPDWTNTSEYKWYPWFTARPGGFGFSDSDYAYWYAGTHCGSRLCLQSEEKADYVGKQFEDIYNEFLTIKEEQ